MAEFQCSQIEGIQDAYQKDGYLIVRDVLDKDLMAKARDHVKWLLKKHPDRRPEQLHHELAIDDPFWIGLIWLIGSRDWGLGES